MMARRAFVEHDRRDIFRERWRVFRSHPSPNGDARAAEDHCECKPRRSPWLAHQSVHPSSVLQVGNEAANRLGSGDGDRSALKR